MEQIKIWEYFQNEAQESFEGSEGRIRFLVKQLPKGSRVLNIGVGGALLEKFAMSKGVAIYSLDPDQKSIEKLQSLIGNRAVVGFSQSIPFEDEFFDYVVMSEVLEHLDDDILVRTIEEVNRVLKAGGVFLGTVPYNEVLEENIVVCPKCGEKFHRWGHVQSFNEDRLGKILGRLFDVDEIEPKMFVTWKILNWKGKIATLFLYFAYLLKIKRSGLNLYFKCTKR